MTDSDTLKGLVEVNASLKRLVEAIQKKLVLPANLARPSETRNCDSGNARAFSSSLDDALERIAEPPVGTQWAGPQPEAPPAERQRPPPAKGHRIREGPVAGRQHTEDRQGQATYGGSRSLEMHRHQTRHQYKKNS